MRSSKPMYLTVFVATVLMVSAGIALAGPPEHATGPAAKATGSGSWTNGQGIDFYAEFNAHEGKGDRPDKGSLLQERVDGTSGGFTVDVDTVTVYDTYACFGGVTTDAWGTYASYGGKYRWTMVSDGGEGVNGSGDYLRGQWTNPQPSFCTNGNPGNNQPWSGGNVQIHSGD